MAGKLIAAAPTTLLGMQYPTQESASLAMLTQEIIDLVSAETEGAELAADSVLQDAGLDSLKFMSVVFKIEARYDIELQEEDAEDLSTVADLANLVLDRVGEQS